MHAAVEPVGVNDLAHFSSIAGEVKVGAETFERGSGLGPHKNREGPKDGFLSVLESSGLRIQNRRGEVVC